MRHSLSKLFLLSLVLIMLLACLPAAYAQPSGGDIGFFNRIEVNESLFNYGFYRHFYAGSGIAYRMDYTGSGATLFDWRVNGGSVFILDSTGVLNHLGPFTTYMLGLKDTDRTHALVHKWNEDDSADRVLNWRVGGGSRILTFNENFTISNGTNITITGEDNDATFTLDNTLFEVENVNATQRTIKIATGTDADATITVEATGAVVNQDTTTDASPTFAGLTNSGRFVNSTLTTFTDGDTTPTVAGTNFFKTGNTGATSITAFDDGVAGQKITIIFGDANTIIVDGANLNLQGGLDFTSTADDVIHLISDGSAWFESGSRSIN